MGFEILENVKMSEIWVVWVVFALSGSCLKGLHLAIDEVCWSDLSPGRNDLKGDVYWRDSEGGDGERTYYRSSV